jgi:hypothetical protein
MTPWGETISQLSRSLPTLDLSGEVDAQARMVLALVAIPAKQSEELLPSDPSTCPNCGEPNDSTKTPYCSHRCKEESAFVRQFRAALADGMAFDENRQIALGEKLWHVLGGGYPRRRALVPERVLRKVIERDGLCICGAPATTIDHTGSG